jgi:hypothetical protein
MPNRAKNVKPQWVPQGDKTGQLTGDGLECADILANQFKSVFGPPTSRWTGNHVHEQETLGLIYFQPEEIQNQRKKSKKTSSPGPDGICSRLLKEGVDLLGLPLSMLFNLSMQLKKVPPGWKSAFTPVLKAGKKEAENYRPISLTSLVCKIMEKIINEKLKEKLEGGFLSSKQHGFREARSCVTNFLTHMEEVIDHVDKKELVDVVYFDFSKAFDVVPR